MTNTNRMDAALASLRQTIDEMAESFPFKRLRDQLSNLRMPGIEWPSLRIGDLVARVPIVQGGMGVGISLSRLASAVANAGGIGVIAANAIGMLEKDYFRNGREANLRALRREIRSAREQTDGIVGVNIMVAVNDFHELLDVAIEEQVDLVIMGAGLPIKDLPVERIRANGVKVAPIVSSVRAVDLIFRMWRKIYNDVPDAVVFEGPKAGGHLGFSEDQLEDPAYSLEALVPQIAEALNRYSRDAGRTIPLIAGGGIYTGEDIYATLQSGAAGVQMGTRFVATDECDADEAFKQAYVDCTQEQIGIIKSPVGMPGRAIRNDFIRSAEAGNRPKFRCAWQCLASCKADAAQYCISIALNNARQGRLNQGFVFVGSNAHRVDRIVPVATLISELAEGYRNTVREQVVRRIEETVASLRELRRQLSTMYGAASTPSL